MLNYKKIGIKMKKLLEIIERWLCYYFGLDKKNLIPQILKQKNGKLIIVNTEPYKRHTFATPADKMNLNLIDPSYKERLGIAMGKLMAKHLIISFDEVIIKREKTHAG